MHILLNINDYIASNARLALGDNIYDSIIYLKGDVSLGLKKALDSKQEFKDGDCIESLGDAFLQTVSSNMDNMCKMFNSTIIDVNNKDIDQVFDEILVALNIKEL
jgi:thymidylate kinase